MNSRNDEFRRVERLDALRRVQDDDDTQVYTSDVALAEAYRCGYKHGMEAAAVICENLPVQQEVDVRDECAAVIRARGTT